MTGDPTVILRSFRVEARGVNEMAQQIRSASNTIMRIPGQIPEFILQVEHSTHSGVDSSSKGARDRRIARVVWLPA